MQYESKVIIDRDHFIEQTDQLFETARSGSVGYADMEQHMNDVLSTLGAIGSTVEIQPPLSSEQESSYRVRSEDFKAMAVKGLRDIHHAQAQAEANRRPKSGGKARKGFFGGGGEPKSRI